MALRSPATAACRCFVAACLLSFYGCLISPKVVILGAAALLTTTSTHHTNMPHTNKHLFLPSFRRTKLLWFTTSSNTLSSGPTSKATAMTLNSNPSSSSSDTSLNHSSSHYLTPELEKMTKAFASLSDEKTRYKQLLFMANQLPPLPDSSKLPENKVPGCLSRVHVDCTAEDDGDGPIRIYFRGDSDGQLTKGLVALLVRGLSGHTADEIDQVDPTFIHTAKISQSLTPGRNNGFLNMLATMKRKAKQAAASYGSSTTTPQTLSSSSDEGRPIYNAILSSLTSILKPIKITLIDNSDQHAGHAGSKGYNGESHFALSIVAEAFEGLPLVKRHQLIYMLLGDIMPQIHALQIEAKSPSEVSS
jgi:sulfur transfer protein SufE/stress-induced morphogen